MFWASRRDDVLATLLYYANWHFIATDQSYFADFAAQSPLRHAWSLSIEEQFYLVWPFLIATALRWWPRWLAGMLAVAAVGASDARDRSHLVRGYLWHWPVLLFSPSFLPAGLPATVLNALRVLLTVALATASFYLIERPIQEGRPRRLVGTPARVALTAATAVAACAAVMVSTTTTTVAVGARDRQLIAAAAAEPCPGTTSICVRIPPHKGVVAVLGDSVGRSLDAGVMELARRRGWGYVLAAHNGCNLSGLHNTKGDVRTPWLDACAEQMPGRIRQVLDEYRPTLVIAVSRWETTTYLGPDGRVVAPMSAQWASDVHDGLLRFAKTVTASGAALAVLPILQQGPTSQTARSTPIRRRAHRRPIPRSTPRTTSTGVSVARYRG